VDVQGDSNGNLSLGIVGGLIGALAGALLYAVIVVSTGYSHWLLAVLLGAAAGGGVKLLGRGAGVAFQGVGVVFTLVGLAAAKYCTVAGVFVSQAKAQGVEVGYFSSETIEIFWPAVKATSEMPGIMLEFAAIYVPLHILSKSRA
jgi:hypothetical protein